MSDIEIGFCLCGCGQRTPIATRTNLSKGYVKGFPLRFISGHNLRGAVRAANDRPHQDRSPFQRGRFDTRTQVGRAARREWTT